MSVSMYQSAILRLNKDKESVQKQISAEQEKVGKLLLGFFRTDSTTKSWFVRQ